MQRLSLHQTHTLCTLHLEPCTLMTVLYFLVPLALILAGASVAAFLWAVRSGQFEDTETPAIRILLDDELEN